METQEEPQSWLSGPIRETTWAELEKKSRKKREAKDRRKANKERERAAIKIEIPNPPEGYETVLGPKKMVNGKAVTGWSVTYVKIPEIVKWEDNPYNKQCKAEAEERRVAEEFEAKLKYWPWRKTVPRQLVTLAPYMFNELRDSSKPGQPFSLPEAVQNCALFQQLLNNDLIAQTLIDILFQSHDTAKRFAATSRKSFKLVGNYIGHWDATRGYFGDCEIERDRSADLTSVQIAEPKQGSVPSVVIVSPIRGPLRIPGNIEELDELKNEERRQLYELQISVLHKMCKSMYNFADFFRNIQFHRIPFLTTEVLSLIIPPMRNLKFLGVYKCQLIHIGHTLKLLSVIQVDKLQERKNQITLEFYPNAHRGPISEGGDVYCTGNYHAAWDNWNGDTRLAIWQLVSRIIPVAQAQGMEWLAKTNSKGEPTAIPAFRQWLDDSPCWRVEDTLETLMQDGTKSDDQLDEDFVVMCDAPNTGGSKRTFFSNVPNRPEGWKWMLERYPCRICHLNPLGIFFYYNDIREAQIFGHTQNLICMACRLVRVLDAEKDHYKDRKRQIITSWLREDLPSEDEDEELVFNDTNMPQALQDFEDREIAKEANKLDRARWNRMKNPRFVEVGNAFDREVEERQVAFTREQLTRIGLRNVSPRVEEKDPVIDQWSWFDPSRKWAHGH